MQRGFQSTLPTRGSDAERHEYGRDAVRISIHAPHEGERQTPREVKPEEPEISIHAPHEGERPRIAKALLSLNPFQSTLPTRGSDEGAEDTIAEAVFQSTLPTRGSD